MNGEDRNHEDETDSGYANGDIIANVSQLISNGRTLHELLKSDKEEVKQNDENNFWYHKKISRESAETILLEGLPRTSSASGLFLIRDSTVSKDDYALSLVSKGKILHFQIQQRCEGCYHIDQGPVIHGLDKLVNHYTQSPNGLPTVLTGFCRGSAPPNSCRKFGPTNLLHRAVLEGNSDVVRRILSDPLCPDVNAKNQKGSVALHDASFHGFYDIVSMLLESGSDVKIKDCNGHAALHRACVADQSQIVDLLIKKGGSNTSERCSQTGWVPLHEAAMRGHINCLKVLLDNDATPFPRNDDRETPLDLAEKYGRRDCVKAFDSFELKELPTKKTDWFHPELDRTGTVKLFEIHSMRSGLFLIRPSKKHLGWHVLSLCHNQAPFNYEIRNQSYRDRLVHYIDDGPYLLSLEHVVYYYSKQMDGLPCVLVASLNTSNKIIEVKIKRPKSTLDSLASPVHLEPPDLPPRLPEGDLYTLPNKDKPSSPIPSPEPSNISPPLPSAPPPAHKKQEANELDSLVIISIKHIKKGHELGQGEYGSVLKGTLTISKGAMRKDKIDVALKTFHQGSVENSRSFLDEARVMQSLDDPCILRLLGVCKGPPLMLVEEYVPMGSMLDFLLDHEEEIEVKTDLYLWAAQIASGMKYLETKRLVHRDLAARNILLQSKKQIKISDFGLSRAVGIGSDYYKATHGGRWPIKWYAPESVNYGQFSHASDVWSYGVTLWEMFTFGEPPYGEMKGIEVVQFIEQGKRLQKPEKCPKVVYGLMKKCWSWKADNRPDFKYLAQHFQEDPEYASVQDFLRR